MPEWVKWVFDGIGTQILSLIIGLIIGGVGGYKIGKHTKSKQIQEAGESAKQKQAISVDDGNTDNDKKNQEISSIIQKQKAGNNAEQIQTGSVKHGRGQTDTKSR